MRDDPYLQFNFLVDLGDGETHSPAAGFSECSGLGMKVDVVEYRNGNDRANHVRKLPGLTRAFDVTLKRGLLGSGDLWAWITGLGDGSLERRDITITLLDERREAVMTWRLHRAWPSKIACGPLHAKRSAVAIEELTLVCESISLA